MRRSAKAALGILAVLAALVLAGYAVFSAGRLGTALMQSLSNDNPGAVFSCAASRWRFPVGLALDGLKVRFKNGEKGPLEAATLVLRPRVLRLLSGRLSLQAHADTYGGKLDGDIDFIRYFKAGGPLNARLKAEGIDLNQCAYLTAAMGSPVKGKLKGTLEYSGDTAGLLKGAGQGHFTVTGADLEVPGKLTGLITGIRFDRAEAEVAFEEGKLRVERLVLGGPNLKSVLKGHVFLEENWDQSGVSLSGKLEVPALSRVRLDFAVTGTVSRPVITVM